MDKNQKKYFTLVVIFCVCLVGLGAFYLGKEIYSKNVVCKTTEDNTAVKEENTEEECIDGIIINGNIKFPNYNGEIYKALYYYLQSGEIDLLTYLKSLDNNKKLYIAGIFSEEEVYGFKFNNDYYGLKNNLEYIFGNDLGVEAKDYYESSIYDEAIFIINNDTKEYSLNENVVTGFITDFGEYYIYNYEINNIEYTTNGYKITYLGLYRVESDIGPSVYTNESTINTNSELNDDIDDYLSEYKDELFKFTYEYTKVNGNYVLTGFTRE